MSAAWACDGSTEPKPDPPVQLSINTMAIEVTGAIRLDEVTEALGGFQHVPTGEGTGIHLEANAGGMPFVIHLPGRPVVGQFSLGPWDAAKDLVRQDTIYNVGRKPSISFGDRNSAVLGSYSSLDGGVVEIHEITIPSPDAFTDNGMAPLGSITGRLTTRAVLDSRLLPPGTPSSPDTVVIFAEFHVALENWPDGRAGTGFVDGALAGLSAPFMIGSATEWTVGPDPDERLLVSIGGFLAASGEYLNIWFGTKLRGPGSAELQPVHPEDGVYRPLTWPDHFIAGRIGDRLLGSVSGSIELEQYVAYEPTTWGEAKGRVTVELGIQRSFGDTGELEFTTAEIEFHVPVGFFVQFCTPDTPGCSSSALVARDARGVPLVRVHGMRK